MSVNQSSSYNHTCHQYIVGWFSELTLISTTTLFLLPLSIFVLHLGVRRSSAAAMSHSDFLTYNIAVMEMIGILGNIVRVAAVYSRQTVMMWIGVVVWYFPWYGQMFFPILICVERYLAVVHPITYLRLKQGGGVCIRNISVVSVWLLCFTSSCLVCFVFKGHFQSFLIVNAVETAFLLTVMIFCSVSVLCVLIRPRPGDRVRVDQSRRRSFYIIVIITGVLLLKFGGNVVSYMLASSPVRNSACVVLLLPGWFNLPSSLVLPLLFLHRAGKLPGC